MTDIVDIDALAYRFWSIHPRELPEPTGMPNGYPGGARAWFYATEMRRLTAIKTSAIIGVVDLGIYHLNAEALSEIKATVDGQSDQSVQAIIYGLLDEIAKLTPTPVNVVQPAVPWAALRETAMANLSKAYHDERDVKIACDFILALIGEKK